MTSGRIWRMLKGKVNVTLDLKNFTGRSWIYSMGLNREIKEYVVVEEKGTSCFEQNEVLET